MVVEKIHVEHYTLFFFKLNKTAAEPKKMIEHADRDGLAGCNICCEWFTKFKNLVNHSKYFELNLNDNEHSGQL